MASIVDVAKKANVSVATVSRMLNGERNVAPDTARVVEEAIRDVGYVPRAVRPGPKPKSRRGIRTGNIAFLSVGSLSPMEMYRMPAFPALLGGIQRGIERHGMELTLAHLPEGLQIPTVLARRRADGVLLYGSESLMSESLQEAVRNVPAVSFLLRGSATPSAIFDHVYYDNARVGELAAEYLLERGHRELLFVSGNASHPAFSERREEFLRVTQEQGARVSVVENSPRDCTATTRAAMHAETAHRAVLALQTPGDRATGIFVASDDLMVAVYNHLRQEGLEPGQDVDLLGCNNDSPYMEQMHPRPATIDIRLNVVGERAVDQLLWRMSHPAEKGHTDMLIRPVIVPPET